MKHGLTISFQSVASEQSIDVGTLLGEDTKSTGLVSEHFAYRIEDSLFWKSQSEAFKAAVKNLRHYRFVTGWTCLDVISEQEPNISVTKRART